MIAATFLAALACTLTAGMSWLALYATSPEQIAAMEEWGVILLYTWGLGVFGLVCLAGHYPYGKMAPANGYSYMGGAKSILGMQVPARVAWCVQESPAFLVPLICWIQAEHSSSTTFGATNKVLLGMFMIHYFQRSFIYALRVRGKPAPLSLVMSCFMFCAGNGLLQGATLTKHYTFEDSHLYSPQFWAGLAMWAFGMFVNCQADNILINLRKPGETGYKIPRGGAFEWVSGANFFGEIIEWYGWGLAGGHGAGMAFGVFTMFNIAPRAYATHNWYLKKFPDYPKSRKAVVPYIL